LILLVFDKTEILLLSTFGSMAKPLTIILCVVTGSLSLTSIIAFFIDLLSASKKQAKLQQRRDMRRSEQKQDVERRKEAVIARIDHLSSQELRYLARCLSNNSTTFNTYVHSPAATTLASKGLTYTPGGAHHQDHYPFIVNDFVWAYLLEHREQIIEKDRANREVEEEAERNRNRRGRRY
jgi:hypothetical protein